MSYRLRISRPALKLRVATRIPARFEVQSPLLLDRSNGIYALSLSIDDLRGSLDPLYFKKRTITGTANEIAVANGDGEDGDPTISLPDALTFTDKTVTGGIYTEAVSVSAGTLTVLDGTDEVLTFKSDVFGQGIPGIEDQNFYSFRYETEPNPHTSQFRVQRKVDYTTGNPANASPTIWGLTDVLAGTVDSHYSLLATMENYSSDGQQVGGNFKANKRGDGHTWAGLSEARDMTHVANPTHALCGHEFDIFANGTDDNLQRVIVSIVGGRDDLSGTKGTISYGLTIRAFNDDNANAHFTNGIWFGGTYTNGINFANATSMDSAIHLKDDFRIHFDTGAARSLSFVSSPGFLAYQVSAATMYAITDSGRHYIVAGSVTDPSIASTGDTASGLYFPANNKVSLVGGGVAGLTVASGDVGVGTSAPSRRLHVLLDDASNNTVSNPFRLTHSTSGTPGTGIGVGLEFEAETSANNLEIGATIKAVTTDATATSEDFDFVFELMTAGATAAAKARLKSTGFFGINCDPAVNLDIAGTGGTQLRAIDGGTVDFRLSASAGSNVSIIGSYSNHGVVFFANAAESFRVNNDRTVQFNSPSMIANGSVATVLGSVGPTGSHTSVQEWFQFKNASGVTRYIPGF